MNKLMNQLNLMDCMKGMSTFEDKYFDWAIVDPPYGTGDLVGHTGKSMDWNRNIPGKEYFKELRRVSKNQIIWGANYFNCFENGGALIWYKNRGGKNLSECEIASISNQQKVDYFKLQVLTGFCEKEERIHPTQKPVELYSHILSKYINVRDKIIDTHVGSASSILAFLKFGIEFYCGFEIDKNCYIKAQNRIKEFKSKNDIINPVKKYTILL